MKKLFAALLIIILPSLLYGQYTVPAHTGATASSGGSPTWTLVNSTLNFSCPTTGTTCASTIPATTAGNVLVIGIVSFAFISGTWSINSINTGGTLTTCTSSLCAKSDATVNGNVDVAGVTSATGGVTAITVTASAASPTGWAVIVDEFNCAHCGPISIDGSCWTSGCVNSSTGCAACIGAAISSLTGPSGTDLLYQVTDLFQSATSISTPYAFTVNDISAWAQSTTGTAPTVNQTPTGGALFTALAFKQ